MSYDNQGGGFISNAIGSLVGGGLGLFGSALASGIMSGAAGQAGQGAQYNPYDVSTGLGQGTFSNGQASFQLSDRYQGLSNQLTGLSGGFLSQAGQFDPNQLAQSQFERMESILQPGRDRQRQAIEGRLLQQGRLGSTGGALTQQSYESAVEQERSRNLWGAMSQGQEIQGNLLNRGMFTMQGAAGLEQQGMQNLQLGANIGGQQAQAGISAGQFGMQGATSQAKLQSSMWAGLGDAAQQYLPQLFQGSPQTNPETGQLTSAYRQQQGYYDIPGA